MNKQLGLVTDLATIVNGVSTYLNTVVSSVNDHVVRIAVMTEPFYWHRHPNSDETFFVIEGSVYIDLDDTTIHLQTGQLFTVPQNVRHRTRPGGGRSVNITVEKADMITIKEDER